jgi:integrase/recombinase XerD
VLAIPTKRHDRAIVNYLTEHETAALIAAPDRSRWIGRRDHALLTLAIQTGLRVSEAHGAALPRRAPDRRAARANARQGPQAAHHPADQTHHRHPARLDQRARRRPRRPAVSHQPRTSAQPRRRRPDRHTHTQTASHACPTLATKTVSPHVLRHTTGMNLLHAGVDTSVIALWFGHESTEATQIYLHADMAIKQRALDRTTPIGVKPGRYRPTGALLAFLEAL